jgi:hypothetical protein
MVRFVVCAAAALLAYAGFTVGQNEFALIENPQTTSTNRQAEEINESEEIERSSRLDAAFAKARSTVAVKKLIADNVATGQVTLAAAGEHFQQLSENAGQSILQSFQMTYPGRSEHERFCRQVIAYALREFEPGDPEGKKLRARLEHDLNEAVASGKVK